MSRRSISSSTAGVQVGRIDPEHGPVRAFRASAAQAIYQSLSSLSPYELRKRFNARDMAAKEIYPDIWTGSVLEEDSLRYLMDNLDKLRAFLRQTVEAQLGLLVFLVWHRPNPDRRVQAAGIDAAQVVGRIGR